MSKPRSNSPASLSIDRRPVQGLHVGDGTSHVRLPLNIAFALPVLDPCSAHAVDVGQQCGADAAQGQHAELADSMIEAAHRRRIVTMAHTLTLSAICGQPSARISQMSSASSGLVGRTRFKVRGPGGACSASDSPCSASALAAGSAAAMSISNTKMKVLVTCAANNGHRSFSGRR